MPATLPLQFIVVGSSISGLTAASCLAEAGHKVIVLEQKRSDQLRGGAVRCPPNLTRLFQSNPVVGEFYAERGVKGQSITFRDGGDCRVIGRMIFPIQLMKDFDADFYLHTYQDLRSMLLQLCDHAGVMIHYDTCVSRVERTKDGVLVESTNGQYFGGDVLVVADGRDSTLRSTISEDEFTETADLCGLEFVLPYSEIANDPELAVFAEERTFTGYAAEGLQIITTSHPAQNELHVGMVYYPPDTHDLVPSLHHLDPRIRRLLELGKPQWQPMHFPEYSVEEWVGLDSRAVLIGSAAHATSVHCSYSTSLATEDGIVLGTLFSHISSHAQIPLLLNTFQDLRQPRANATQHGEYLRFTVLALPDGEARNKRNEAFGATLQLSDGFVNGSGLEQGLGKSELLAEVWKDFVESYAYDARLAVEEWWQMWGRKVEELV